MWHCIESFGEIEQNERRNLPLIDGYAHVFGDTKEGSLGAMPFMKSCLPLVKQMVILEKARELFMNQPLENLRHFTKMRNWPCV